MAKGKESRSLLDAIKNDINRSSSGNFSLLFKLREPGQKCRIRFLDDFEDALPVVFHDKWNGFNHPCLEQYGKDCPNCDNPEGRTSTSYYWNIYNYETKKEELFGFKANKASPIPALVAVYEMIGDLTTQDLVIQRNGDGTNTTYTVLPTGKEIPFRKKAKKMSEKAIMKFLYETFNEYGDDYEADDYDDEEDDIADAATKKKSSNKPAAKKGKPNPHYEEDEDFEEDDEQEKPDYDYYNMTLKELRAECKKRGLKVLRDDDEYDLTEKLEEHDEEEDGLPFDDEDEEDELPPPKRKNRRK